MRLPRLPRLPRDNRGTWITAIALGFVAIVVAALAVHELTKTTVKNTYDPTIAFSTTTTGTTPKVPAASKFLWPVYGLNDARTRVFNGPAVFNNPANLKVGWKLSGNAPLEFPPDINGNTLYFMDDNASVNRVNALTGKRIWRKQIGTWSAASPALDPKKNLLFVPVLSKTGDEPGNGAFVAMKMSSGETVWSVPVPSGTESSPMIWGNNVYFGDQDGTVYDLNALTGKIIWQFQSDGAEKGGPTLANGILYFGTYGGTVYAVNARTGKSVWEVTIGGTVYASPTIAYGRIYVGTTAGGMYSLSAATGAVAWSVSAGGYVYSSAAVDNTPGLGPTVYFGAYRGTSSGVAYAVNAKTGAVDWDKSFGGSISGAASIVNNTVFFSSVYPGHNFSKGYNITTGAQDFYFNDGAYTTTVASPDAIFLSGHYVLYEFVPKS